MPAKKMKRPSQTRHRDPVRSVAAIPAPIESTRETLRADPALDQEEIARLAHSYWEARGCQGGSPGDDWLRAERELKAMRAAAGSG
jgi:hypothetical protein